MSTETIPTIAPWTEEEARKLQGTARICLEGDPWHRSGRCKKWSQTERMSCGSCALEGYEPRGGWGDDHQVKRDGPNYAGWARIYVEAGQPIPRQWLQAFQAQRDSDNRAYASALERSILTFGFTWGH